MELASMLANEPFSDRPANVSPVIGAFLRTYNDGVDDERRHDLYPLAASIVGTAGRRALERERASRCLEFARGLGARAPSGRAAIGIATAEASGSWAALAALRTGPSAETHVRALAFARELVDLQTDGSPRWWAFWLAGRDPAQAVREAIAGDRRDEAIAGGRRDEAIAGGRHEFEGGEEQPDRARTFTASFTPGVR
jgi:hypothetical protein